MRREFTSDPHDPSVVVEAVYDDDELQETITHDATKPGPGLVRAVSTPESPVKVQQEERVSWAAVAGYTALAISIGHGILDAVR